MLRGGVFAIIRTDLLVVDNYDLLAISKFSQKYEIFTNNSMISQKYKAPDPNSSNIVTTDTRSINNYNSGYLLVVDNCDLLSISKISQKIRNFHK